MNPFFIDDTTPALYNDWGVEPYIPFTVKNVTIGPIGIQDTSDELTSKFWGAAFKQSTQELLLIDTEEETTEVILTETDGMVKVALAFDQNANDTYAWITNLGDLKIRWFDASLPGDAIINFGAAQSVTLTMDTKYYPSSIDSDILLFYIRNGAIFYRIQRDKYATEYTTAVTEDAISLLDSGTRKDYRFQVRYTKLPEP